MVVLSTTTEKIQGNARYFIYDCNNGVVNQEFNEKLRDFLQDAVKNYDPNDKKIIKNLDAIKDLLKSLPEGKISTEKLDIILNMIMEVKT